MQNPIVKNILACVVLAILCFVVGSLVTESYIASAGVIAIFFGIAFMLFMGDRSWMLIFLLAPLLELLPLPHPMAVVPKGFYVAGLVLAHWISMWLIGQAKIRWRSLGALDVAVLLLTILMVATYIRRPVSVAFLGMEGDNIGGAEYAYFVMALVYYLTLSIIPISFQQLSRILNISVALTLVATFILLLMVLAGFRGEIDFAEATSAGADRIRGFYRYGPPFCLAIFAYFSITSIFVNPVLLVAVLMSYVPILLSGSRSAMGLLGLNIIVLVILKRQFLVSIVLGIMIYAMLLVFSLGGGVSELPLGVQRIVAMLPGIQTSERAVRDGQVTLNWREELWALAWDERTGYIKDYIFGDGYGQSKSATERMQRALIRREFDQSQGLDGFAVNGVWHHGVITTIHRVGYIGLSVFALVMALGVFYVLRVCLAWRGTPLFKPLLFYVSAFAVFPLRFVWAAPDLFFHFVHLGLIKLAYCMALEEGRIAPIFRRRRYQPLMIQEHGERIKSPFAHV